jgi:Plasma-membrane choline transporter
LTAGRNVFQLFQSKGWTVIITDDLADNVLFMMSVGIGMATGLIGMFMGLANPNLLSGLGEFDSSGAAGPAFLIAFLVGLLLSSIFMSVVQSAVNTVIVCYAEAPAEFQMNHPQLSGEMRSAWTSAWPGIVN